MKTTAVPSINQVKNQKKDAPVNWKGEDSEGFAECRVSAAVRF